MATMEATNLIPPQVLAELQAAADRAAKGLLNPEIRAKACERMDHLRKQSHREYGILDIGVAAIRELRDGE